MPRLKLIAALLIVAAAAAGCSSSNDAADVTPVVAVQVVHAARGPIQQWVRAQAVLYPLHQAVITPKISAPVTQFFVTRGDTVHAGELLATLENKDLAAAAQTAQGQLAVAQANYDTAIAADIPAQLEAAQLDLTSTQKALANAQSIFTNRQTLYVQGAIPKRDLDQAGVDLANAQTAYQLAQQHVQALEHGGHAQALEAAHGGLDAAQGQAAAAAAQLGYSRITSPIDGVVAARPMYPGELATPSAPLMTIVDLSQIVARVPLSLAEAAGLRLGDAATLTAPGLAAPVPARVTVVSPATDPGSTTVEVWVQAQNPDGRLRPGATVQVAILAGTIPQALLVPAAALLTDSTGATTVMVVGADGKAHQTNVTVGAQAAGQVQILAGLAAGVEVVTTGAYGLPDDTPITVTPSSAP